MIESGFLFMFLRVNFVILRFYKFVSLLKMANLLDDLNSKQREAVEFCDGPSLIIAGAGSGKTRVLTYKIAYLLEKGLPPYYILALTFTNKASREMKSRIAELVGERKARQLWMGTFHSIFSRILRNEAEKIGFDSNFTIYDASDSSNLIKTIIKEMQLDEKIYKPGSVHKQISRAKNGLVTPAMYARNTELLDYDRSAGRSQLVEIYGRYQARLQNGNNMDFDDLLLYTNILFRDNPDVLENYRNRFQYILVDEYQDTNFAQHLIVKQLGGCHQRVCVVGDDAQSIYSFRGADIDNILKFKTSFPDTQIFKLEQNYRSTRTIVNAANSLIKKNKEQIFKNVFSENEEGEKIEVLSAFSDFEEGILVSGKIARLRLEEHASFSDFAVLYRTNAQSRIFEEALRKNNIPYRIYGGLSFYQRKEVKDIIGYFRLIVNSGDEEALRRIINYPSRGIGSATVAKIAESASLHGVSMWHVLSEPLVYNLDIHAGTAKRLSAFREGMQKLMEENRQLDAYQLAQRVLQVTGIAESAYEDMTPEGMSRAQNMQELLNALNEFVSMRREAGEERVGLVDFLSESSLLTDQDVGDAAGEERVTLMTVHAAKGLEFGHVFVVGMEEDLFPSGRARFDRKGIEEERRLFYVAITRAKKTCTLSYAKSRFKNGAINPTRESSFLKDIDGQFLMGESLPSSSRDEPSGGFWNSLRRDRIADSSFRRFEPAARYQPHSKPYSSPATSSIPLSQEAEELRKGDVIEHERFGRGVVLSVEEAGGDKRAFVEFEAAGQKQLLLKYARFKIIK